MTGRAHAILAPSGAERWINCPSSARAEEEAVTKDPSLADGTDWSREGTLCHEIAELYLRGWRDFGGWPPDYELDTLRSHKLYSKEIEEAALEYVELVKDHFAQALALDPSAKLYIEKRVNLTNWAPESFGKLDCGIVYGTTLKIVDLKGGKGVAVDAVDNSQTRLYAAGLLEEVQEFWPITTVDCIICQPRLDNVTHETLTVPELREWLAARVVPAAKIAWAGNGGFKPGDWCQFCKIRPTCRARAEVYQKEAEAAFADPVPAPSTLSPDEIAALLPRLDLIKTWAKDLGEYALMATLHHGVKFGDWKVVYGRSKREITDKEKAVTTLVAAGVPEPLLFERKMYGITALEKAVGKKKLTEVLGELIHKPPGKPTLVPGGDRRPEVDRNAAAQAVFGPATDETED